jgi:hypothetical protein
MVLTCLAGPLAVFGSDLVLLACIYQREITMALQNLLRLDRWTGVIAAGLLTNALFAIATSLAPSLRPLSSTSNSSRGNHFWPMAGLV